MKKVLTAVSVVVAVAVTLAPSAFASTPLCPTVTGGANAAAPAQLHGPFICAAASASRTPRARVASISVKGCTVTANLPPYGGGYWWQGKGTIDCNANHQTLQMQAWLNMSNGNGWVFVPNSKGTFYHAGGNAGVTGYGAWVQVGNGLYLRSVMYYNIDGQSGYLGGSVKVS